MRSICSTILHFGLLISQLSILEAQVNSTGLSDSGGNRYDVINNVRWFPELSILLLIPRAQYIMEIVDCFIGCQKLFFVNHIALMADDRHSTAITTSAKFDKFFFLFLLRNSSFFFFWWILHSFSSFFFIIHVIYSFLSFFFVLFHYSCYLFFFIILLRSFSFL